MRSIELVDDRSRLVSDLLIAGGAIDEPIELPPTDVDNPRSTNEYTLTKLMANKLYRTGDLDALRLVEGHPYDYGSNAGRIISDDLLETVMRSLWTPYTDLLRHHGLAADAIRSTWAGEPHDDRFVDPTVRDEVIGHIHQVYAAHVAAVRATKRRNRLEARRHERNAERVRKLEVKVTRLESEAEKRSARLDRTNTKLERTTARFDATKSKLDAAITERDRSVADARATREELQLARTELATTKSLADSTAQKLLAAEREAQRTARRLELLTVWRPSNWRVYPSAALRRVRRLSRRVPRGD